MSSNINSPEDLAVAIRQRRRDLHLTQTDVALSTGLNRRVVGELERGKSSVRWEIVLKITRALGLDIQLSARGGKRA
jgi:DNA-binding XRE family transcriptional regulator